MMMCMLVDMCVVCLCTRVSTENCARHSARFDEVKHSFPASATNNTGAVLTANASVVSTHAFDTPAVAAAAAVCRVLLKRVTHTRRYDNESPNHTINPTVTTQSTGTTSHTTETSPMRALVL